MKILVLGYDGYIGYPLTLHLLKLGHEVYGIDNVSRRRRITKLKSDSLTPILSVVGRIEYLKNNYSNFVGHSATYLGNSPAIHIREILNYFKPDAIVHLAEQPSAAWSMDNASRASITQNENVIGTLHLLWAMHKECSTAHLVKLGTMGEYGTPNCSIPEGMIPSWCLLHENEPLQKPGDYQPCPMSGLLFPRTAGSFYHLSKVMDTLNIEFACRNWGLYSTDIMQGVVFGLANPACQEELTRFDYDECFGTAINRFCTQAIINHPLTIYGEGNQTRGFLTLSDSVQCITLAIENPPLAGEYRTLNQFESIYSINRLALMVHEEANKLGLNTKLDHLTNPRKEAESHYYNPDHQKLFDLGYVPTTNTPSEISKLIQQVLPFKNRVNKEVIMPKVSWK